MSYSPGHQTTTEPCQKTGPSSPPTSPITAFPEVSDPKRAALVSQILEIYEVTSVDSITWALVWLADLSALEAMVEMSSITYAKQMIQKNLRADFYPLLKDWLLKFRNQTSKRDDEREAESESTAGGNTSSPSLAQYSYNDPVGATLKVGHRNTRMGRPSANHPGCSKRDQDKCIVTKAGEPNDTAHIFGRALGIRHQQKDAHDIMWDILKIFWSPERIKSWHDTIFGGSGTETPKNLLTLNKTVHALWGKARFALRPIQSTATELKMEFYWLPGRERNKVNLCEKPTDGKPAASPLNCRLLDCEYFDMIVSGRLITLTTSDPENMPLPSFELLEMQWFLNRVAAMSGAADFIEPDEEDDDELYGVTSRALLSEETVVPELSQSVGRVISRRLSPVDTNRQENLPLLQRPRQESPGKQRETLSPGVSPSRYTLR